MSKRTYIVGAIVILLIISQLILVRLVYAHKLSPNFSYHISKIYSLKAGTVSQNDVDLKIILFNHYQRIYIPPGGTQLYKASRYCMDFQITNL